MKNTKVSVIIPNWNGKHLLVDCLSSLKEQSYKNFQVIVVDNGSIDDSVIFLTNNFPEHFLIKLKKNYGFAKAINEGVRNCKSQYVVLLNNDTVVDKNWLKELVNLADKHSEVISINSKMLNFYQKDIFDGIGIEVNEVGQAKSIAWQESDHNQYPTPFYIFGATGGASLFRRREFVNLGMFDEGYFMYFEEVDFAFRANFVGFRSLYCPTAIVFHKHKATANKKPQHIEYWQFKNMYQTIITDYPTKLLFKDWRWLKIILVFLNTILYQLKNGYYWPPVMVTLWLLFNLPKLLHKRLHVLKQKIDLDYIESFFASKQITFWKILK